MFYLGVRIGNLLPTTTTQTAMVVKVQGMEVLGGGERGSVWIPLTKTIRHPICRCIWAAPNVMFCPVEAVSALTSQHGELNKGEVPLALNPKTRKPLCRAAFMGEVRRWMSKVDGLDASRYSGVSFRKGCLQELARAGVSSPDIAAQATHSDEQSQRHYISLDEKVQQLNAGHLTKLF